MAKAPRDYTRYELRDKGKVVYRGISSDPDRRIAEHESDGKHFTSVNKVGPRVTKDAARKWEQSSLETFRKNHGGRNPKYNKDRDG